MPRRIEIGRPSSTTSRGPRMRNSTPVPRFDRSTACRGCLARELPANYRSNGRIVGRECSSSDRPGVFLANERRWAARENQEGMMVSKTTVSRFVGLVFLVAALSRSARRTRCTSTGTTPQGLKADGLRLQGIAEQVSRRCAATRSRPQGRRPALPGNGSAYANRAGGQLLHAAGARRRRGCAGSAMARPTRKPQVVRGQQLRLGRSRHRCDRRLRSAAVVRAVLIVGIRRIRQEKLAV